MDGCTITHRKVSNFMHCYSCTIKMFRSLIHSRPRSLNCAECTGANRVANRFVCDVEKSNFSQSLTVKFKSSPNMPCSSTPHFNTRNTLVLNSFVLRYRQSTGFAIIISSSGPFFSIYTMIIIQLQKCRLDVPSVKEIWPHPSYASEYRDDSQYAWRSFFKYMIVSKRYGLLGKFEVYCTKFSCWRTHYQLKEKKTFCIRHIKSSKHGTAVLIFGQRNAAGLKD